jgi:4-hydroxy-tetrahydrodipicolinate synthase
MRRGSTVALVTPFVPETGAVDVPALIKILQYHVEAGTPNLCILGTTGESAVLDPSERELVWKTAVEQVKGKMTLLAGTGTIDPTAVKALTQQAADLGCDASLVVTPYYVKPPQRCLIDHMVTAAEGPLPVVIYNVPGRTGVNMFDESIAVAAQHENIVGLKDATGDVSRVESLRPLVPEDFLIYSGDDGTTLDFLSKGGDGCISVTANVAAKEMADMVAAALEGRMEDATAINDKLEALHTKLFCESNPIPTKWAMKRMGMIDSAYCRPPLAQLDPKLESVVEAAMVQAGLV